VREEEALCDEEFFESDDDEDFFLPELELELLFLWREDFLALSLSVILMDMWQ
jgi:hypothetical protein